VKDGMTADCKPTEPVRPTPRRKLVIALLAWGGPLVVVLGFALFLAFTWHVRNEVESAAKLYTEGTICEREVFNRLGGDGSAKRKLILYMNLPERFTDRRAAVTYLLFYGGHEQAASLEKTLSGSEVSAIRRNVQARRALRKPLSAAEVQALLNLPGDDDEAEAFLATKYLVYWASLAVRASCSERHARSGRRLCGLFLRRPLDKSPRWLVAYQPLLHSPSMDVRRTAATELIGVSVKPEIALAVDDACVAEYHPDARLRMKDVRKKIKGFVPAVPARGVAAQAP